MKQLILFLLLCITQLSIAQNFDSYLINKQVKNFLYTNDFSTPLNAFTSIQYLWANGKYQKAYEKSSIRIRQRDPKGVSDKEVTSERKKMLLDSYIEKVITYCDSVAAVITLSPDSIYRYYFMNLEQNVWVNGGSDRSESIDMAEKRIHNLLPIRLNMLRRINRIIETPTDTSSFTAYLKENGKDPKRFLLEVLKTHRLVIYGERHREKLSWELLSDLIKDTDFRKCTGTVFMELPSYKQNDIDRFFTNTNYMDSSILVSIYQDCMPFGWYDKGGFEFLKTLWELNSKLTNDQRINVIFVDYQEPLSKIKTNEEFLLYREKAPKRDTYMASMITKAIQNSPKKRNNLFIVGFDHAHKSSAIETYLGGVNSAAHQLVNQFTDKDVYCTRVHTSGIMGYTRGGMFDIVFAQNGGSPTAFELKDSPFGMEIYENKAFETDNFGSYENNFDGYIYLGGEPIDKHPEYRLTEIYTEDFVQEIKRRAHLLKMDEVEWFNVPNKSLTLDDVLENLNEDQ